MSADKLEEVDIGSGDKPRPTFVSANLQPDFREELIKLLKEYKDCFAWDYSEMPGLDRSIVEHRLPIKSGFKPYKQPPQKIYKDEVLVATGHVVSYISPHVLPLVPCLQIFVHLCAA
jgi:hypothetical protein